MSYGGWSKRALDSAAVTLPDADALAPRMLGIGKHRYRSVRFFRDPATKAWKRYESWMTTIVDLDTGQVLGIVDGRDTEGVGDRLFARPLQWRLGVQIVAIDPSAAFCKVLRDVAAAAHGLGRRVPSGQARQHMLTEVRQRGLTQPVHSRRGRPIDPVWAHRRLPLRGGETLSDRARDRLRPCSPRMTPPESCRQPGWSESSSGRCSPLDPLPRPPRRTHARSG